MKVIEESGMVLGEFEEERLFLIIAEAEEGWLLGPKAELEERLMRLRKIWKADILKFFSYKPHKFKILLKPL